MVGYDLTKDVALLQLSNASGLTTVKTGDSSTLSTGDKIVGIGNAGGTGGTPSFAAGTIKALDQSITAGDESNPAGSEKLTGLVEVNADILPGDSGGPLVTSKGRVIGMDTAGSSANGGFGFEQFGVTATSRGYAIPIKEALDIVTSIENGNSSSNVSTLARRPFSVSSSIPRPRSHPVNPDRSRHRASPLRVWFPVNPRPTPGSRPATSSPH